MSRSMGARRRNSVPHTSPVLKGGYTRTLNERGNPTREENDRVLGRFVFFSKTFRQVELPQEKPGDPVRTELVFDPGETARRWIDEHGNLQYISQRDVDRIVAERKAAQEKANADSD